MKKTLMKKVAMTANVTYDNGGQMEVEPVFKREIFDEELSFRARVKRDKHGNTFVTPVQEGRIGCRYDVLLDTSCGCVMATDGQLTLVGRTWHITEKAKMELVCKNGCKFRV